MSTQTDEILGEEINVINRIHLYDEYQTCEYLYPFDDISTGTQEEIKKVVDDALLENNSCFSTQENSSQNPCSNNSAFVAVSLNCCPTSSPNFSGLSYDNLRNGDLDDTEESNSDELKPAYCTERDYPNDSEKSYGKNKWSMANAILTNSDGCVPQYYIRNQDREAINILENGEDKIQLNNLKEKCSSINSDEQYWFHATTWDKAQNIIKTGPVLSEKPSDYSSKGAFYLNPSYVDCYEWFVAHNSTFNGSHAMLIYKFHPNELSKKREEPAVKQWRQNVKTRSTTPCRNNLDWSLVPQNANPKSIHKNEKVRHRWTHHGDIAMQLVIHTANMCAKVHPCLVACVFYRHVATNKLPYQYQYTKHDFLKISSNSTKEMSRILQNNNDTPSNIGQQQQNDDQMKTCDSNNSKRQKQSEHKRKKNNRQAK